MITKIILICLQICLIKSAFSQCFGAKPVVADSLGLAGAAGPAWPVLLENYPMPATGLSIVADELVIEGLVSVSGKLPFLGTVSLEGLLPTTGQGSVVYGCGNGEVGIVEESGPLGVGPGLAYPGPAYPGPAFGPAAPYKAAANAGLTAMAGL